MKKPVENFFENMLYYFPATRDEYEKKIEEYGKRLDTVIIEDIFMPKVLELLIEDKNIELIKDIFNYFEEVSNCKDEYLINIFSITVLEILGNDKDILLIAQKYMGSKTRELQIIADRSLGRCCPSN